MKDLWWLSFADENGFRGVLIVEGDDFLDAVQTANRRGLNPGGEVVGIGPLAVVENNIPQTHRNRLLTKEDCRELDRLNGGEGNIVNPMNGEGL